MNITDEQVIASCASISNIYSAFFDRMSEVNNYSTFEGLNIVRPITDYLGDIYSQNGDLSEGCGLSFNFMNSPEKFTKVACDTDMYKDGNCTSGGRPQTFGHEKCSSIKSTFSNYTIGKEISGCDFECKIRPFSNPMEYLYQITPRIALSAWLTFESAYFSNMYASYKTCGIIPNTPADYITPFYKLSSDLVFSAPTNAVYDPFFMTDLNITMTNKNGNGNAIYKYLFVDSKTFKKFVKQYNTSITNCCQMLNGFMGIAGNYQQIVDSTTKTAIINVPDKYIAYDITTKRPILTLVNPMEYFMLALPNAFLGQSAFGGMVKRMSDGYMFSLSSNYIPISGRYGESSIDYELTAKYLFAVKGGAVRKRGDGIKYILGDVEADTAVFTKRGMTGITIGSDVSVIPMD